MLSRHTAESGCRHLITVCKLPRLKIQRINKGELMNKYIGALIAGIGAAVFAYGFAWVREPQLQGLMIFVAIMAATRIPHNHETGE